MSAPPRVIYLQIGDDHEGEYTDEATWCADKIHNTDIAYVLRSDYDELQAMLTEVKRLNKVALEALKELRYACTDKAEAMTDNAIKEIEGSKP